MTNEDKEKTTFITSYGTFYYKVMPFKLKNTRATYKRAMLTLFHNVMHKKVKVYMDEMIVKSKKKEDLVRI
jgi:hypothetical protein